MQEKEKIEFEAALEWYLKGAKKELDAHPGYQDEVISSNLSVTEGEKKARDFLASNGESASYSEQIPSSRLEVYSLFDEIPVISDPKNGRLMDKGFRVTGSGESAFSPYVPELKYYVNRLILSHTSKDNIFLVDKLVRGVLADIPLKSRLHAETQGGIFDEDVLASAPEESAKRILYLEHGIIIFSGDKFDFKDYTTDEVQLLETAGVFSALENEPSLARYQELKKSCMAGVYESINKIVAERFKEGNRPIDRKIQDFSASHGVQLEGDHIDKEGRIWGSFTESDIDFLHKLYSVGFPLLVGIKKITRDIPKQPPIKFESASRVAQNRTYEILSGALFNKRGEAFVYEPENYLLRDLESTAYVVDQDSALKMVLVDLADKYYSNLNPEQRSRFQRVSPRASRMASLSRLGGGGVDPEKNLQSALRAEFINAAIKVLSTVIAKGEKPSTPQEEFLVSLLKIKPQLNA